MPLAERRRMHACMHAAAADGRSMVYVKASKLKRVSSDRSVAEGCARAGCARVASELETLGTGDTSASIRLAICTDPRPVSACLPSRACLDAWSASYLLELDHAGGRQGRAGEISRGSHGGWLMRSVTRFVHGSSVHALARGQAAAGVVLDGSLLLPCVARPHMI